MSPSDLAETRLPGSAASTLENVAIASVTWPDSRCARPRATCAERYVGCEKRPRWSVERASASRPLLRYSSASARKRREPGSRSIRRFRSRMRASAAESAKFGKSKPPPEGGGVSYPSGANHGAMTQGSVYWKLAPEVTEQLEFVRLVTTKGIGAPTGVSVPAGSAPLQVGAAADVGGMCTVTDDEEPEAIGRSTPPNVTRMLVRFVPVRVASRPPAGTSPEVGMTPPTVGAVDRYWNVRPLVVSPVLTFVTSIVPDAPEQFSVLPGSTTSS